MTDASQRLRAQVAAGELQSDAAQLEVRSGSTIWRAT
jgi:hypothetical protein